MAFCGMLIACAACTQARRETEPTVVEMMSDEERLANAVPARTTPEITGEVVGAAPAGEAVNLAQPLVAAPAVAPEMNDFTSNLVEGYWRVIFVVQGAGKSREPYASQQGRFWRFDPRGVYQLFNADGTLFHEGTWAFQRIDDKRNYLTLDAVVAEHDNYYRAMMQPNYFTLVGTEKFGNNDVQQRMEKLATPPAVPSLN